MAILKNQNEMTKELFKDERNEELNESKRSFNNELNQLNKEVENNKEIEKNDIRKFLIECVIMGEDAESGTESSLDEFEEDVIISAEEAERDWGITKDFVNFIYNCEIGLDNEEKKNFRNDLRKLIIKFHTMNDTVKFTDYLNKEFIGKWEPIITDVKGFREKLNNFFGDD